MLTSDVEQIVRWNGESFDVLSLFPHSDAPLLPSHEERSSGWQKLAHNTVVKHPYCAVCGGKHSLQVHHKKPFHLYPELELVKGNLIVLCIRDHLVFGHLGDWKAYNPNIDKDIDLWK